MSEENKESKESEENTRKEDKIEYHNHEDCPPDRRKLGHDSWTLLHTMAVYYIPTKENEDYLLNFLISLSHLYPCKLCALHMRMYMRENPPELDSQESYVVWLSKFHNEISRYIGNKEYPEDYEWNIKRWKSGLSHCINKNVNENEVTSEESINCEDVSLLEITKNVIKNKLK